MTVDELFRVQYGLVTRDQCREVGLSDRQIDYRVCAGQWVREYRSVYRHSAVPPSWESALLAGVLATGGIAAARSAAALWYLDVFSRPKPEIVVPDGTWRRMTGVVLHQSTQWDRRDEVVKRGIPCTGIERTLLDTGAVVSLRTLERMSESAIRKSYTSWVSLLQCLMNHSIQGRTGCGTLRRLLEKRLNDRTVPLSDFSRLVANLLSDAGLPAPELEFRIVDDSGDLILQVDLAWPELRKAWELDGLAFHFGRTEVERDYRKRNRAKAFGWNIQEILWSMYVDDPEALVQMAKMFLKH